jgi:hypothetical protein
MWRRRARNLRGAAAAQKPDFRKDAAVDLARDYRAFSAIIS